MNTEQFELLEDIKQFLEKDCKKEIVSLDTDGITEEKIAFKFCIKTKEGMKK